MWPLGTTGQMITLAGEVKKDKATTPTKEIEYQLAQGNAPNRYNSDSCHETGLVSQPEKPTEDRSFLQRDEPLFGKQPRASFPRTQGISGITLLIEAAKERAGSMDSTTTTSDECAIDDSDDDDEDPGKPNFYRISVRPPRRIRRSHIVECPPKSYEMTSDLSLLRKLGGDGIYRPETIYKSKEPDDTDPQALYWFILENCSHF
ncbi:hypothetical protein F4810DRAFT_707166 [Camillea tinctor]|nr:hypothetical protein F4810DRAFT_707166 [Camillea tinctor]